MPESEALIYIFAAGVAANGIWRLIGAVVSTGVAEDSAVIAWVRAISTALVAGLIARIVLFPPGALADIDPVIRVGAFVVGVSTFFLVGRNMAAGILVGAGTLTIAHLLIS